LVREVFNALYLLVFVVIIITSLLLRVIYYIHISTCISFHIRGIHSLVIIYSLCHIVYQSEANFIIKFKASLVTVFTYTHNHNLTNKETNTPQQHDTITLNPTPSRLFRVKPLMILLGVVPRNTYTLARCVHIRLNRPFPSSFHSFDLLSHGQELLIVLAPHRGFILRLCFIGRRMFLEEHVQDLLKVRFRFHEIDLNRFGVTVAGADRRVRWICGFAAAVADSRVYY